MGQYFLYILQSLKKGEYYVGVSADVDRRIKQHNAGIVAATKFKKPYREVFRQSFSSKKVALKLERKIKNWKRKDFLEKIIADGYIRITGG